MKMWYGQICIACTPQSILINPPSKYRLCSAYEPKRNSTLQHQVPTRHQDSSTDQYRRRKNRMREAGRATSYQCHDHRVQVEEEHDQMES